ncbi:hypothetical protein HNY73_010751 [Argiope bruennichi]|uniref:Uncharacterized protein n=1 Tax=Argiope bruennichi TaxID=94029 RepID=A0A8T0F227_ARGBR|nr:hypothetical protein HNY73_010751 [Argiope bruennichi]
MASERGCGLPENTLGKGGTHEKVLIESFAECAADYPVTIELCNIARIEATDHCTYFHSAASRANTSTSTVSWKPRNPTPTLGTRFVQSNPVSVACRHVVRLP